MAVNGEHIEDLPMEFAIKEEPESEKGINFEALSANVLNDQVINIQHFSNAAGFKCEPEASEENGQGSSSSSSQTSSGIPEGKTLNSPEVIDILRKVLQTSKQNQAQLLELRRELAELKASLNPRQAVEGIVDVADVCEVLPNQLTNHDDLLVFCLKLEEVPFRRNVVGYFAALGGKDVADLVRNALNKLMTNTLMMEYNVFGRGSMGKRPIKDLPKLTDVLSMAVKQRFPDSTKVLESVVHAMGEYLKGAKRRAATKESQSVYVALSPKRIMLEEAFRYNPDVS